MILEVNSEGHPSEYHKCELKSIRSTWMGDHRIHGLALCRYDSSKSLHNQNLLDKLG